MLGAADSVLVVLHHHNGIALAFQFAERVEQHAVVARVQTDGGFIEDVTHAAQIGAELRGEPDALRFAAAQGRRGPVQGQIGQAHIGEEPQAGLQLGQNVTRDLGVAALEFEAVEQGAAGLHRQTGEIGDGPVAEPNRQCLGIEAPAITAGAQWRFALPPIRPPDFLATLLLVEAGELEAGAIAGLAPAVLGVVGEQARVQLLETASATGTGAVGGKGGFTAGRDDRNHTVAERQRAVQQIAQGGFVFRRHGDAADRQFDVVFPVAVQARPGFGRQ